MPKLTFVQILAFLPMFGTLPFLRCMMNPPCSINRDWYNLLQKALYMFYIVYFQSLILFLIFGNFTDSSTIKGVASITLLFLIYLILHLFILGRGVSCFTLLKPNKLYILILIIEGTLAIYYQGSLSHLIIWN